VYTINGGSASKRYPQIVRGAARMEGSAIIDAEVVWFDSEGTPDSDRRSFCLLVRPSDLFTASLCGPKSSVAKASASRSRHPVRRARRRL